MFFLLSLVFQPKKTAVRVVFKCKICLKNPIKIRKIIFLAAAWVKVFFFVTRISGNKSIIIFFFFGGGEANQEYQ